MRKLLLAPPLAAMAMIAADRALRRFRPVQIPAGLGAEVVRMEAMGWTMPRWEPFFCDADGPHTHLTAPGGLRLTIGIDRQVAIR